MASIAEQAEQDKMYDHDYDFPLSENCDVTEFLARNAIESTERLGVKGIITDSKTGLTARNLAAFRGPNPVLAICYKEKTQRWLALSYGVIPVAQHEQIGAQEQFLAALRMLRQKGYLRMEDKIAYLSGSFGRGGGTTFLEINKYRKYSTAHMSFICQIRRGNRIARLEHLQMINIEHNLYKRVETILLSPRVLYMANRKTYASVFKCIYSLLIYTLLVLFVS